MRKVDYSRRAIVNMTKHLPSVSSVVNSTKTPIKKAKKKYISRFHDSSFIGDTKLFSFTIHFANQHLCDHNIY